MFLFPAALFGQLDYDTTYIKSYRDKLVVTALTSADDSELNASRSSDNRSLDFQTSTRQQVGLGLDYKWFTLEATIGIGSKTDPLRGNTETWGFGFGLTSRKWWFRNFFRGYHGYYLGNPQDWDTAWAVGDPYPQASGLRTRTYYAEWNYTFNYEKYSNMASLWQLEKQLKSAGTWNIGITFAGSTMDNTDGPLIPIEYNGFFGPLDSINALSVLSLGLNFGYLYNWRISKNWFLSVGLVPGLAFQAGITEDLEGGESNYRNRLSGTVHSRLIGGYNGDKWYGGLRVYSHGFSTDTTGEYPLDLSYVNVRFYLGYRFELNHSIEFFKKIGL